MTERGTFPSLDNLSAFLRGLPLEVEVVEPTRVVATMELGPDPHKPWGVVHGGAYTTAIESVASVGASSAVWERGQFAVGLNLEGRYGYRTCPFRGQLLPAANRGGADYRGVTRGSGGGAAQPTRLMSSTTTYSTGSN